MHPNTALAFFVDKHHCRWNVKGTKSVIQALEPDQRLLKRVQHLIEGHQGQIGQGAAELLQCDLDTYISIFALFVQFLVKEDLHHGKLRLRAPLDGLHLRKQIWRWNPDLLFVENLGLDRSEGDPPGVIGMVIHALEGGPLRALEEHRALLLRWFHIFY